MNEMTTLSLEHHQLISRLIFNYGDEKIPCKILSFSPHGELPKNYKKHYGLRISGINSKNQLMIYGFDLFYVTTGCGIDLESQLDFCLKHNLCVDWYNYQRTAYKSGWTHESLLKKIKYPYIDVFGLEDWKELEKSLNVVFLQYFQSNK